MDHPEALGLVQHNERPIFIDLEGAVQCFSNIPGDPCALIFDVLVIAPFLLRPVERRRQRKLLIDPMDALTPPFRLLALPGKGLEVRDGAAVQDVPSEMDRKMPGQPAFS
jgi:hypothetical protein